jgi:hypothetical protein
MSERITKRKFEVKLANTFTGNLTKYAHVENGYAGAEMIINKMTLYYENGNHIATWQTGTGWFI